MITLASVPALQMWSYQGSTLSECLLKKKKNQQKKQKGKKKEKSEA